MPSDDHRPVLPYLSLAGGASRAPEQLWDAWAFAAMEAELALDAWKRAAVGLKDAAFAAYRAALDREEKAAAELASRIAPKVGRELQIRAAGARSAA
jgi:hypothetical protein